MSDHFGIGQAMLGMAHCYINTSRMTGRTTSLIESLKDGDRVVFTNSKEAKRVERLCRDRGLKVSCIVVSVYEPERLLERGSSQGRTIFDHTWVEQYYLFYLEQCARNIDELQSKTSGLWYEDTKMLRAEQEYRKWPMNGLNNES